MSTKCLTNSITIVVNMQQFAQFWGVTLIYSNVQKLGEGNCFLFEYVLKCTVIYSCDGKAEFSAAITPVISVTWSFRNHSNMLICHSRNISHYYQCWKKLCCLIFLWKQLYILFYYLSDPKPSNGSICCRTKREVNINHRLIKTSWGNQWLENANSLPGF